MKISFKGDYAIKTLVYLSIIYMESGDKERYVRLSEITASQDIPESFLEQIMLVLKNAGYVKTHRGKNGGYALGRNPNSIRLGEIIRLIDGTTAPIGCVSCTAYKYCDFEKKCALKPVWEEVRNAVNSIVDNITIKSLVVKQAELERETKGELSLAYKGGFYI